MNTGWRPKGWDFTHKDVPSKLPIFDPSSLCDLTIFEAGASAMLETLEKEGQHIEDGEDYCSPCECCNTEEDCKAAETGWLIFIPDKEG